MTSEAKWVEVHRLAVAGREAAVAHAVGNHVGRAWLARSRFTDVAQMAEQTLSLGADAGSFYDLGWAKRATGYPAEALAAFEEALNNIGAVFSGLGEWQRALESFERALPIRQEVGDRVGEATTLNNIGTVHDQSGQPQRALEFYSRALPILREVGDRTGEALARHNVAMIHRQQKDLDRAVAELEQVVELDRQIDHPDLDVDAAMLERVRLEQRMGQTGDAQ